MSPYILAISYFFHLVATVLWLGGLIVIALLVLPEATRVVGGTPAYAPLLRALRKRFTPIANFSLVILWVTGMIQMSGDPNYDGVLAITNEWSVAMLLKHLANFGMIVCGLLLQWLIVPELDRTSILIERGKGDAAVLARLTGRERAVTLVNIGFSLAVLVFTAWATAL